MKKTISLLLVLLLTVSCVAFAAPAPAAEPFDYASLSDAELSAIIDSASAELASRSAGSANAKEVSVPQGSYIVGQEIPVGTYSLSLDGENTILATVVLYSDKDGKDDYTKMLNMFMITEDTPIGRVDLKDGNLIEITGSTVLFKPVGSLGF